MGQLAQAHQLLETAYHIKAIRVITHSIRFPPSCYHETRPVAYQLRVLADATPRRGTCSSQLAIGASIGWIIALFPVTTAPAGRPGRLDNRYLVAASSFHLVHLIGREVRCPLDLRADTAEWNRTEQFPRRLARFPGSSRSPIHDAGARPLFRHRAAPAWREGWHLSCLGGRRRAQDDPGDRSTCLSPSTD